MEVDPPVTGSGLFQFAGADHAILVDMEANPVAGPAARAQAFDFLETWFRTGAPEIRDPLP
jgi:hypothetical protein